MTASQLAKFTPSKSDTLKIVDVPPRLILEVAMGVEEPSSIAQRYGYYGREWEALNKYAPFNAAVENKRRELSSSGYTFKTRAHIMATDLLEDVYLEAKKESTNSHTRLETLKFLAKAGGVESPVEVNQSGSTGVSIIINIPGTAASPARTIELNTVDVIESLDENIPDYLSGAKQLKIEIDPMP